MSTKQIYWHRELPPLDAEPAGEYEVEAMSLRIQGTLAHRDEQWSACYDSLMDHARERLHQEVERLGGSCAHVLSESVDARHNDNTGEAWLHGSFRYMLFKRPGQPEPR